MVKQLVRLIAALALAGGTILTVSGPACACSCIPNPDLSERVAKADLVFNGHAVDTTVDGQTKVITFEVDTTYKGPPEMTREILTARDSAGCGLEIEEKVDYLVFATKGDHGLQLKPTDDQYTAILCGGADPMTNELYKKLVKVEGVTQTQVIEDPAPSTAPSTAPAKAPAKVQPTGADTQATPEQASTGAPAWPWAAGAVLLLAAAGGLVWRRRNRA